MVSKPIFRHKTFDLFLHLVFLMYIRLILQRLECLTELDALLNGVYAASVNDRLSPLARKRQLLHLLLLSLLQVPRQEFRQGLALELPSQFAHLPLRLIYQRVDSLRLGHSTRKLVLRI